MAKSTPSPASPPPLGSSRPSLRVAQCQRTSLRPRLSAAYKAPSPHRTRSAGAPEWTGIETLLPAITWPRRLEGPLEPLHVERDVEMGLPHGEQHGGRTMTPSRAKRKGGAPSSSSVARHGPTTLAYWRSST
jgi:hypothetical protein